MTVKEANAIAGKLGNPSKMPGKSYGLPAVLTCRVGSRLRRCPGSVCSHCYARRGNYIMPDVKTGQARRLRGLQDSRWTEAMVTLIARSKTEYFRWHDSGDIVSVEHLANIYAVARALPDVRFWLPTREVATVKAAIKAYGPPPANLCIRLSAPMIGGRALDMPFTTASTVGRPGGYDCPAPRQGNNCGKCRACWSARFPVVNYHLH